MKRPEERELLLVLELAAEVGVQVKATQAETLLAHLDAVLSANERLNLTAITRRESAITLHIVDSLAALPHIGGHAGHVADLGSGAGYPGIPLAVVAESPVELIESTRKKAAFLEECVLQLGGLHGTLVVPLRAEEIARERPGRYGVVVARAVSSLASLVELATPLLARGGRLIAMKGKPTEEERSAGKAAGRIVGMEEQDWLEYALPGTGDLRTIVTYCRCGDSEIELPRRVGLAQKRPLA